MSSADRQPPAGAGGQTREWAGHGAAWANEPSPGIPQDNAAGFEAVADALAQLTARLTDNSEHPGTTGSTDQGAHATGAEVNAQSARGRAPVDWHEIDTSGPSLEDAWDQAAADALAELNAADAAGWWRRASDDPELRARLAALPQAVAHAAAPDTSQAHLSSAIERRFDELEQCIGFVLRDLATRADVAGLKHLEAQVDGLLAHADEARAGFARIFSIENRLAALKATLDDQSARPTAAGAPADYDLERIADATADRIVQRLAADAGQAGASLPAGFADGLADARLAQLQDMFAEFAGEQRRNERQVAEALDTMQEAMERILDRIDEIEAQQRNLAAHAVEPRAVERFQLDTYPEPHHWTGLDTTEQVKAEARPEAAPASAPNMAEFGFGDTSWTEPHPEAERKGWASTAWSVMPRSWQAAGIGMPSAHRRDDGQATSTIARPGALVIASLIAFLMAGFWLATGGRLHAPVDLASRTDQHTLDRGVAELAAKEIGPQGQHKTSEAGTAAQSRPGTSAAVPDHGVQGIAIERSDVVLSPEDLARIQQRQRMAHLSSRAGKQAAETFAGGDLVTGTTGQASPDNDHRGPSVWELPPLAIGPNSLRLAAAQGDAAAQFEVAARFAEGKGVKQDFEQASIWYQRAAEQGLATAQYRVATHYERGLGVAPNSAQALAWYQRAAEHGNVKAMHNLAVLSAGKDAANPDYAIAARWFTAAAEHGLSDSQYNLGIMYENGLGVPKDLATAYQWYGLAALTGDREAERRKQALRTRLDPGALKRAEQQLEAWQARPMDPAVNDPRAAAEAWKARASAPAG